jgi:CheY-like chemotaxis protein
MTTRGTILVVDDEALTRRGIAALLQEEGYLVYQAADDTVALRMLETRRPPHSARLRTAAWQIREEESRFLPIPRKFVPWRARLRPVHLA